jgi:serine/threonine protein kinase
MKMQCALKKISKEKLRENPVYEDLMKDELATLQNVSHPKIMRVFELLQDNTDIYVVTEFIKGGELLNRLITNNNFSEKQAAYIIY